MDIILHKIILDVYLAHNLLNIAFNVHQVQSVQNVKKIVDLMMIPLLAKNVL